MIDAIVTNESGLRAAFPSVDAALRFAFGNYHRQKPGTLARFMRRGPDSIFEDANERAAWAGDIRRRVGEMHPTSAAVLAVRFAPRSFPCSCRRACCSGWSANPEWQDAMGVVVSDSTIAVTGVSHRQLRLGVVRRWAGAERVNIGALADKCGVHRNTAGSHAKSIRRWLDAAFAVAMDEASRRLGATVD